MPVVPTSLIEFASKIATPLAAFGLIAAVLFGILSQIITNKILAKSSAQHSAKIILRIINVLFILALVALILGFAGYIVSLNSLSARTEAKVAEIDKYRDEVKGIRDTMVAVARDSNAARSDIQKVQDSANDTGTMAKAASESAKQATQIVKDASSNIDTLKIELARLKNRNDVTLLADQAISEGSVSAYRTLEKKVNENISQDTIELLNLANMPLSVAQNILSLDEKNAATAELVRVYEAYSFAAPTRLASFHIIAGAINYNKSKEEELDADDIINFLNDSGKPHLTNYDPTVATNAIGDGLTRAKLAQLLADKVKRGSFKTANAIVNAIRNETHLEAFKQLGIAFDRVTGHSEGGKLDHREILDWWENHKEELKKNDTDKT